MTPKVRLTNEVLTVLGLCLVSLAMNAGYCLLLEDRLVVSSDAASYDLRGIDVAQGRGFPTTGGLQPKREPGIYAFLGAVYFVFGHSHRAARLVQALLASTFCFLVFRIVRRYRDAGYVPPAAPLVAGALTVLYPAYVFYAGLLMREILVTFLFLVSLVFLTDYVLKPRLRSAVLYGLFAGLGGLVDGRLFYFALFFGLVLLALHRDRRSAVFLAVTLAGALLVIAPWTIRNYMVFGRFVLLATSQYKGLFLVTGPEELLEWDWEREPLRSLRDLPEDERERTLARLALENLQSDPSPYLFSAPRRLVRLWIGGHSNVTPFWTQSTSAALSSGAWGYVATKSFFVLWNLAYLIGGLAGAARFMRHHGVKPISHLVAFLVFLSLLHMALFATPRYHIPAAPVLTLFLAYLISDTLVGRRARVVNAFA